MKRNSFLVAVFFVVVVGTEPRVCFAQFEGDGQGATTEAAAELAATDEEEGIPLLGVGAGCGAGALLGSVVPGLGNAIGCIAGGVIGWFMS